MPEPTMRWHKSRRAGRVHYCDETGRSACGAFYTQLSEPLKDWNPGNPKTCCVCWVKWKKQENEALL